MGGARMTIKELKENIIAQFESEFGQTVSLLKRSFIRVLSVVLSSVVVFLYKYLGYMFLQQFPTTASMDYTEVGTKRIRPLVEWGRTVGAGEPQFATQAELTASVTVTDSGVTGITAGVQLIYPDTGIVFTVIADVAIPSIGTYGIPVRATGDQSGTFGAGVQGNLPDGTVLQFVTPQVGLTSTAPVASQEVIGADEETDDAYLQRVLDRLQKRPQGGAYADYEEWAEEVEGCLNSYGYAGDPGTVKVYIESTVAINADGIAPPTLITGVYDNIESKRPAGAKVEVVSIIRTPVDIEITGLAQTDDLAGLKVDIETAVDEYFRAAEPYTPGISVPYTRNDSVSSGGLGGVVNGVVAANGAVYVSAVMRISAVTLERYQLPEGTKVKLGVATYV